MVHFRSFFIDTCTASRLDLDAEEIARVEKRFETVLARRPRVIALIVGGALGMLVTGCLIGSAVGGFVETLGGSDLIIGITAGVITPACLVAVWFAIFPRIYRRGVRQALRDCGFGVCLGCGYNLAGSEASVRCPECGRTRPAPMTDEADATSP